MESTEGAFIVYEFVEGRTLRNELANRRFRGEGFDDAALQLTEALAAAHRQRLLDYRGYVHENRAATDGS